MTVFHTILTFNSLPTETAPPEEILFGDEDILWGEEDITFND
jgi:hypothetical protein